MSGYLDPSVKPRTVREAATFAEIKRLGLSIHRCHARGDALRISGPGVAILTTSLASVNLADLKPYMPKSA
jgi:hypothetical protein